jgi:hypothetical protein
MCVPGGMGIETLDFERCLSKISARRLKSHHSPQELSQDLGH